MRAALGARVAPAVGLGFPLVVLTSPEATLTGWPLMAAALLPRLVWSCQVTKGDYGIDRWIICGY